MEGTTSAEYSSLRPSVSRASLSMGESAASTRRWECTLAPPRQNTMVS